MPGTAPQGWQNPKTSYSAEDVLTPEQFERIEGNAYATELGARTIDPSQAPTGNVGTLRQFLDWLANRIRAITGKTNWYDAPDTTLAAAKQHIDAAAPHSGHETPSGAQAKVDAHAAGTNVHGATSAATANRIMMRDAAGRAKVAAPSAADDIARKDTVDAKFDPVTGHNHSGTEGEGPVLVPCVAPGDFIVISSDDERAVYTSDTIYTKKKEIQIFFSGGVRVNFDLSAANQGKSVWGKIYVNDLAVGTERFTSMTSRTTFSEDISGLQPGDRVQIYCKALNESGGGGYLTNFRLGVSSFYGAAVTQN